MTGLVDWAVRHARMVLAMVVMSVVAGAWAYVSLPKQGAPDIDIPAVFISVPFPGISAEDSEKLLVKPMEKYLKEIEGVKSLYGTAAEGYAGMVLEFEFNWNKTEALAAIRDKMNRAEAEFPDGAKKYTISEINFSQFPVIVVSLSGEVPERTLLRLARAMQDEYEAMPEVLEAKLTGYRKEMVEVVIDPLRLEAYNVTAGELISVVTNNNRLIAAGEIESRDGAFAIKIPASFNDVEDIYRLPVKVNGDRIVTLGDLAEIRLTFEDRKGTARFNGQPTVALQIVKRKGANIIDTVRKVRVKTAELAAAWPAPLRQAVNLDVSMDLSREVRSMVSQLEGSVLSAIALVMIVVLASLGLRSALLVGFAIPTSFFLTFALLAMLGIPVSNVVMFGLILAVGMLVDGAIVVVEYADRKIADGIGPMRAYAMAARRMFWPIVSSTATTLAAFLPMLFWPGVPGEFMGMLPVTLIFVLTASLVVALIYLPVIGGLAGRLSRLLERRAARLRRRGWVLRLLLFIAAGAVLYAGIMGFLNPSWLPEHLPALPPLPEGAALALSGVLFLAGGLGLSVTSAALRPRPRNRRIRAGYRRSPFGRLMAFIVGNPVMPVVTVILVGLFVAFSFALYQKHGKGVEFFVDTDPERAIVYVMARGNLSIEQKDALVRMAERRVRAVPGIDAVFSFAGGKGLNRFTGKAGPPRDTIGQIQIELVPWEERKNGPTGKEILARVAERLADLPGIRTEIRKESHGPGGGKPVQLRLEGDDFAALKKAVEIVRRHMAEIPALVDVEDTRPLPGIDWRVDVDVEKAGRFGADVTTAGAMIQLVTRGLLLDTMRVESSDDEIDIRVRVPKKDRLLSTLDTLRVRTRDGLVPLANFLSRKPVAQLAQINRVGGKRFFDIKANIDKSVMLEIRDAAGNVRTIPANATAIIDRLTKWLEETHPLPPGVSWEWKGDREDQKESAAFLSKAFLAALGLMFLILLAQFNSFYQSVLVLVAVVLSTAGVLIGMVVMGQPFSVIMTGTGIVALAGIVVNNNIVLIDTYQEYSRTMEPIEAVIRTAEARLRPVFLTTVTTMAGLTPMMLGISIDFIGGGYTVDAPTALWWKPLATAVVFGLGIATMLTLVLTPSLLAIPVWLRRIGRGLALRLSAVRSPRAAEALVLSGDRWHRGLREIDWGTLEALYAETPAADASDMREEAGKQDKPSRPPRTETARPDEAEVPPVRAAE